MDLAREREIIGDPEENSVNETMEAETDCWGVIRRYELIKEGKEMKTVNVEKYSGDFS